jgi:hypothetical protein
MSVELHPKIQEALRDHERTCILCLPDLVHMLQADQELESKILNHIRKTGETDKIPLKEFLSQEMWERLSRSNNETYQHQLTKGTFTGYGLCFRRVRGDCYLVWCGA